MNRIGLLAVAALLVAVVPLGAAAGSGLTAADAVGLGPAPDANGANGNETANTTANPSTSEPGARLAGVLGAQGAELDGEVETRSLSVRLQRTDSPGAEAAVVADAAADLEARLGALRERKETLTAARENGSISRAAYRAKVAALAPRIETVERLADRTSRTARGLPEAARRERGVNVTALERLRANASDLGGGEVAAIARQVGGRDRGARADERANGPPDGAGSAEGSAGGADGAPGNGTGAGSERGGDGAVRGANASAPERGGGNGSGEQAGDSGAGEGPPDGGAADDAGSGGGDGDGAQKGSDVGSAGEGGSPALGSADPERWRRG